jgi:AcrR family transcriptional regulator
MTVKAADAEPAGSEVMADEEASSVLQGRRERKKQRTREALIDAAFRLFQAQGFEATTVEEIADAVDVSSRTFFRYFASKEDVVLTVQEEQFHAVLTALRARPADEPVFSAMRHAAVEVARATENGQMGLDPARAQCLLDMSSSSPSVLARTLEHSQRKQADLTMLIAERMGVDPAVDMRPHVVAAMGGCVFHAVADMVQYDPQPDTPLSEILDQAFAIIEGGVNFPSVPPGDARE